MKKIIVENNEKNKKLKEYVMTECGYSGRLLKRLLSEGLITVDGKKGYGDTKVKPGAVIEIEEFEKTDEMHLHAEDLKLSVLAETESFIAVHKSAGVSMMPSEKLTAGTLANGVAFLFKERGIEAPIRFLNRLDRDTSGVVIIPLSGYHHSRIQAAYEAGEKVYFAVVEGCPENEEGLISGPLMKDYSAEGKMKISSIGVHAETSYRVIEKFQGCSLLELRLLTGRTHQIRVHLSHIGCPIIGDILYNEKKGGMGRQALHAGLISFIDPESGETVVIQSPLAEDMKDFIESLRLGK